MLEEFDILQGLEDTPTPYNPLAKIDDAFCLICKPNFQTIAIKIGYFFDSW